MHDISLRHASFGTITNAILGTVAHSKCSILIAEARLTILDRLVYFHPTSGYDMINKMLLYCKCICYLVSI